MTQLPLPEFWLACPTTTASNALITQRDYAISDKSFNLVII